MGAEAVFLLAPNMAGLSGFPNSILGATEKLSLALAADWAEFLAWPAAGGFGPRPSLVALLSAFLMDLMRNLACALVAGSEAATLTCWHSSSHWSLDPVLWNRLATDNTSASKTEEIKSHKL